MECGRCIYWNGEFLDKSAKCTRYPKWAETEKAHFCGEFKGDLMSYYDKTGRKPMAKYYYENITNHCEEKRATRKENTKLRKQNKSLRDLYKKDTGKIARLVQSSDHNTNAV